MDVFYRKSFLKQYQKLPYEIQQKVEERLRIFAENPSNPILNNHSLHGGYEKHRSINITGDYRAIYIMADKDSALFSGVGTHSELYS